jgi:16S rRNA processing protein RimM
MGRVAAPYAVRGWLKIQPFSEYTDSLLDYPVWQVERQAGWQPHRVLEARLHAQFLIAHLEGIDDRDTAERLVGSHVAVDRHELPPAGEDEYYWRDLIGLSVVNQDGVDLGRVAGLLETGAHDVLRILGERERLLPFTGPVVREVDLAQGRIIVDWDADW